MCVRRQIEVGGTQGLNVVCLMIVRTYQVLTVVVRYDSTVPPLGSATLVIFVRVRVCLWLCVFVWGCVFCFQVKMRLRAFYDDACFTVAAQDAFLSGFAAEVAHALNIKVELVIDLNAFHTNKHNEMEVIN